MKPETKKIYALAVYLGDRQVGIINRLQGDHHIFSFVQDYIDDPNPPILSLSFKTSSGDMIAPTRPVKTRLPPFFSNLLPEGHLASYLAQKIGVKKEREFFLLEALGLDLPGAVLIKPIEMSESAVSSHNEARTIFSAEEKITLRFSLAGVQLKFSAIAEASGRLTIPANGMNGSWIVKLPSTKFPAVPENEFLMMSLAHDLGINVPAVKLMPIKDIKGLPQDTGNFSGNALAIKRFDRGSKGERIHMEDFAQVFGIFPHSKYEKRNYSNIASVLWAEAGEDSTYEFIRRIVFSIMIGNADMHLKNWSLLYPNGLTPVLSPAYDLVSTVPYLPNDNLALTFGGSRSLNSITKDQVRRFVDKASLPMNKVWDIINETANQTIEAWHSLEQKDLLPPEILNQINEHIIAVVIES
ncbi:MAG: serine/threonine-protein kinase HipA [Nitrospinales bacterium]|jgi:serine/threonine-protein kinase HipA